MSISRKTFLKQFLAGTASAVFAPRILMARPAVYKKLVILHTNDTHARIESFPKNHPEFGGMGGFAKRAELVEQVRAQEKNVLLLDAGDVFQGTPYFNLYGGELDYKLMSKLRYDASTLGNHEFDNGVDGWLKVRKFAEFPILNSNYKISRTDAREAVDNLLVKELGGVKVGIFGLGINFKGLILESQHEGFRYFDPVNTARGVARNLKQYLDCDFVICLSHLGFEYEGDAVSDKIIAREVPDIDLIIGGHTHTFLDKPFEVYHTDGRITRIVQAGFGGIRLGRIDYQFNPLNEIKAVAQAQMLVSQKMG
jgi:5'-nucleotidase